VGEVVENWLE
jgi:dynein heavy chain 2, cytosolic